VVGGVRVLVQEDLAEEKVEVDGGGCLGFTEKGFRIQVER
jgi:hypothetical protein